MSPFSRPEVNNNRSLGQYLVQAHSYPFPNVIMRSMTVDWESLPENRLVALDRVENAVAYSMIGCLVFIVTYVRLSNFYEAR